MKRILLIILFSLIGFFHSYSLQAETYRKPLPNIAKTLDPIVFSDVFSLTIINQLYDRLFDIDELNNVKSKLASGWEVNSDGTKYKICLRNDVVFHDGKMLTSDDVVFTLQRLLSKKSVFSNEFSIIKGARAFQSGGQKTVKGIQINSPSCLTIELEKPFPIFINMLAALKTEVIPFQFHGRSEEDFFKQPVGTGPFKILKYEPGKYIELIANEKYFLGPPKLKNLAYEKTDRSNAIVNFNKGHYQDVEWYYPQLTELTTNYSVIKIPTSATSTIIFNLRKSPLGNVHFRRAISYAIDKKELVDSCFPGSALAHGYIPPGLAGYNKELPDYAYNMQMAQEELKLAKLPKDSFATPITILRADNYPCREVFEKLVEANLKAAGINADVVHLSFAEIMENHFKPRDFDIINISFTADFPEALFMLSDFRGNSQANYSGLSLPEVDNLLNIAGSSSDRYERYQTYEKIQKLLYENAVTVNLHYHTISIVMQSNVKGFLPTPLGTFYSSMWPVYLEEDEK